jgi:hypothetical protein
VAAKKKTKARPKKTIGRPSLLTPALTKRICDSVRLGAGLEVAAAAENIPGRYAEDWQAKGRLAERKGKLVGNDAAYLAFSQAVARARAEFELDILRRLQTLDASKQVEMMGAIVTVAVIDPKVAGALSKSLTWLLERCRRERYGSQITVKVEEAKSYLLDTLERVCDRMGAAEVLAAVLEELERGGSEEAAGETGEEPGLAVH